MTTLPPSSQWRRHCRQAAWIAALFLLAVAGLLFAGYGERGGVLAVDSPEIAALKAELARRPGDLALKERIRDLDLAQRREFFRREQRQRLGTWLLLAGTAVCLGAAHLSGWTRLPSPPQPPVQLPDLARRNRAARRGLAAAGAVLALGTGFVAWRLPQAAPPASAATTANAAPAPAALPPPTTAEMARQWPGFRGFTGSGICPFPDMPREWDVPSGRNVRWRVEVPLPGWSSPIVWGDAVFVTGASQTERALFCYDAATGALRWRQAVSTPAGSREPAPEVAEDTGYAAPTPATDGRHVFAVFANGDVAAFDMTGRPLWNRHVTIKSNTYGHASSPALWRDLLILQFDQGTAEDGLSALLALRTGTGEQVWRTRREVPGSWASPIVLPQGDDAALIVTAADPWASGYDAASGRELWRVECLRGDVAPSPVAGNGMVYVAMSYANLAAIRTGGNGNVTASHVAWTVTENLPDIASPLCDGPRLYVTEADVLYCYDAATGKPLWKGELGNKFIASPTLVGDRLYLLDEQGTMHFVAAAAEFKVLGQAVLGEHCGASPAFLPGAIVLRGAKHLVCLGTPTPPKPNP